MEIVLVRHGEPEWVRDGLNVVDPPLTARGAAQAQRTADALASTHFDEVLVSPLRRARETAAPLLAAMGIAEVVEPWLREIQEPDWHGTPAELAAKAYADDRARPGEERWGGVEGGEPARDFVERVRTGAAQFLAARGIYRARQMLPIWHMDHSDARIGIVAHSGTDGVILCHLLGLDPVPWEWDRFVVGHASITRLSTLALGDGHTFSLTSLGDVEHLPADTRTR